jgi:hypothetical protein
VADIQQEFGKLRAFAGFAQKSLSKILENCEKRTVKESDTAARIEYFSYNKDGSEKILHTQAIKLSDVAAQIEKISSVIESKEAAKQELKGIISIIKGE